MLANTPAMLECHHGVPMAGAVLNALNTRLDPGALAFMLDHGEAKALIVDREYSATISAALKLAKVRPLTIDYDDPEYDGPGARLGGLDYEGCSPRGTKVTTRDAPARRMGRHRPQLHLRHDRRSQGRRLSPSRRQPAGDRQCRRRRYRRAHPVYLWTLPMFHCNGWCFPWSVCVKAGVHVCFRQVRAKTVYDLIAEHRVTHLCGAPIVMSVLLKATPEEKQPLPHLVRFFTAAAPPPASILQAMSEAGFEVTHLYGLTEVYGPAVDQRMEGGMERPAAAEQAGGAQRRGRGCAIRVLESLDVLDPETMASPSPPTGRRWAR